MKKKEQKALDLEKALWFHLTSLVFIKWWADLLNNLKPKRYVLRTLIIVQGQNESANEFADTLNGEFETLFYVRHIQFTTSANGRQTCNIIYRVSI